MSADYAIDFMYYSQGKETRICPDESEDESDEPLDLLGLQKIAHVTKEHLLPRDGSVLKKSVFPSSATVTRICAQFKEEHAFGRCTVGKR